MCSLVDWLLRIKDVIAAAALNDPKSNFKWNELFFWRGGRGNISNVINSAATLIQIDLVHVDRKFIHVLTLIRAGYINQNTPRAGYYFSFTFTVIGASLLFLAKMYRRSAPASLFLGSAAVCSPSFQCSTSESHSQRSGAAAPAATCDKECHQEKSSQEPLFRAESSNGHPIQVIRTVHQDVCTCITQHQPLDRLNSRQKLLRNLRQTITLKLDGLQHAWV